MNNETEKPWLGFDDDTEFLCGNKMGFELLAAAIQQLQEGESPVSLDSPNLCFPGIRLQEPQDLQPPAIDILPKFAGCILLSLLVLGILTAGFGLLLILNFLFNFQ